MIFILGHPPRTPKVTSSFLWRSCHELSEFKDFSAHRSHIPGHPGCGGPGLVCEGARQTEPETQREAGPLPGSLGAQLYQLQRGQSAVQRVSPPGPALRPPPGSQTAGGDPPGAPAGLDGGLCGWRWAGGPGQENSREGWRGLEPASRTTRVRAWCWIQQSGLDTKGQRRGSRAAFLSLLPSRQQRRGLPWAPRWSTVGSAGSSMRDPPKVTAGALSSGLGLDPGWGGEPKGDFPGICPLSQEVAAAAGLVTSVFWQPWGGVTRHLIICHLAGHLWLQVWVWPLVGFPSPWLSSPGPGFVKQPVSSLERRPLPTPAVLSTLGRCQAGPADACSGEGVEGDREQVALRPRQAEQCQLRDQSGHEPLLPTPPDPMASAGLHGGPRKTPISQPSSLQTPSS